MIATNLPGIRKDITRPTCHSRLQDSHKILCNELLISVVSIDIPFGPRYFSIPFGDTIETIDAFEDFVDFVAFVKVKV